jgi:hypothetical protein
MVTLRATATETSARTWMAETRVETTPGSTVTTTLRFGNDVPDLGNDVPDLGTDAVLPSPTWRRRVTVTAGGTALPAGYTVRVPLEASFLSNAQSAGRLRADRNDLRLRTTGAANSAERDRIIDESPPGESPAVWFSLAAGIAAGTSGTYYLHYGAPNPGPPPSNGSLVFLLYDDFPGNTVHAQWTVNGAPVVTGGLLRLRRNQQDGITTGGDNIPIGSIMEGRLRATNPASAGRDVNGETFWWWFGYRRTSEWVLWIQRAANNVGAEIEEFPCVAGICNRSFTLDDSFHVYRIERAFDGTRFYRDGAMAYSNIQGSTTDQSVLIRNYAVTSDLEVDWVRVRQSITPAPSIVLAAEEMGGF